MRDPLSKTERREIVSLANEAFAHLATKYGFQPCSRKNLWSKEFENCLGYLRFKRTSNFAEHPNLQLNFGLTPKLTPDVKIVLSELLKTDEPMYEIWSHRIRTPSEHFKLNARAIY